MRTVICAMCVTQVHVKFDHNSKGIFSISNKNKMPLSLFFEPFIPWPNQYGGYLENK